MSSFRRRLMLLVGLASAALSVGTATAQDEPRGANAVGGAEMSAGHHDGDHQGPIGPYLSAAELRNWPQGSRRPTPERLVRERSTEILASAGTPCDIVAAHNPGATRQRKEIYEVACRQGPGFLIVATTPAPAILNCLHLAATEEAQRARDPDRPVTSLCLLDENRNAATALRPMAVGVAPACVVDQAAWVGRVGEDEDRYEIGCADGDGMWLQTRINQTAVTATFSCLEVASTGAKCRFTTDAEQARAVASWLPPTALQTCRPDRARYVGASGPARYFELGCEGAPGLMLRTRDGGAFDQAWPCMQANGIAGGCKLTDRTDP